MRKRSKKMRYKGIWGNRLKIDEGRKAGQKKLRSANKNRALAARYRGEAL